MKRLIVSVKKTADGERGILQILEIVDDLGVTAITMIADEIDVADMIHKPFENLAEEISEALDGHDLSR